MKEERRWRLHRWWKSSAGGGARVAGATEQATARCGGGQRRSEQQCPTAVTSTADLWAVKADQAMTAWQWYLY